MNRRSKKLLVRRTKFLIAIASSVYLAAGVAFAEDIDMVQTGGLATEHPVEINPMEPIAAEKEEERFMEYSVPDKFTAEGASFPADIQQYTYSTAKAYGVPYELILAMIETESSYNPNAVSGCNAVGYMQIIKKWHTDRMEKLGVEDLKDPESNILVGIDYIAELMEEYPIEVALGIYNMGFDAVDLWNSGVTTSYARKVMGRYDEILEEMKR